MASNGNPFAAIAAGQDATGQNTAPSPSSSDGNPFSALSQQIQQDQSSPNQDLSWDMVKNNVQSIANGTNPNIQQLKDAAVGAGKSIVKGFGVVGDLATGGLTHLLPGSENASAGISAPGKALAPTNDDQKAGGYVGDLVNFELGSGIFNSLKALPLAERVLQTAKALRAAQEHPVLAKIASTALQGAAEGGTGTLVSTGDPKTAAEGAAVGAVVAPVAQGVGKAVQYVRDIYKPLETSEAVQPVIQNAIRDVVSQTAKDAGVEAPTSQSIRDVVSDLAEKVKAKSQPVFQQIDELSGGKFSDAQAEAARYRGSVDKAGKDAYVEAVQKQEKIFDSVKARMDPDALNTARADWKRYNSLNEVSDALQRSTSGSRPEIAAASKSAQPPETVNTKQLLGKMNQLFNEGTLQTAFGDKAHALLDHIGAAQSRLVSIADNLAAQKSQQRAVKEVGKFAVKTAVGAGAVAEGAKLAGVLGGHKK